MKIKVFEAFSGYGSQSLALERLKQSYPEFDYEVIGISEIDKYAIQAYNTLHPNVHNYGDISKIDWSSVPDFDLFTYSFPCTDISAAGLQKGFEKGSGTRSSLLWECERIIATKLLMENVSALVTKKFIPLFYEWQLLLETYGYSNFSQIMNSKDYGVPQNRERIFMVSILGDEQYFFPQPFKSDKRLKDVLEQSVDEKYYLSDKTVQSMRDHCERKQSEGCGFKFEPTDGRGIVKTISTLAGNRQTDNFIEEPINTDLASGTAMEVIQIGNIVDDTNIGFKNPQRGRVYDIRGISPALNCCGGGGLEPKILTPKRTEYGKQIRKQYESGRTKESRHNMTELEPRTDGMANTITTVQKDNLLLEPKMIAKTNMTLCINSKVNGKQPSLQDRIYDVNGISTALTCSFLPNILAERQSSRIRKLTPRECFRLMDVEEENIDKLLDNGISNSQLYKLAGNSIVVNCLYHIFRKMFIEKNNKNQQLSLF